jgi:hypothetical protein
MAEALKTFREGEDILASETNENNQFLLSKLSDNAAQVQSYVEGEVATIKSNVASVQATLQENINALDTKMQEVKAYVIEFSQGTNNCYIVWSNGYCEQWGYHTNTGDGQDLNVVINLPKAYRDDNYNVQVTNYYNGVGHAPAYINWKNTTQISLRRYGHGYRFDWRACGYLRAGSY